MKPSPRISTSRPGLALPMTIIAVAGLTLLLVGLLTVLTLERKTARSYSDAARADLAVESGLAVALGTITEIAKRDDSIVFRIEDPTEPTVDEAQRPLGFREQFFTYGAVYDNGNWRGLPLFSGSPEVALGSREIEAERLEAVITNYTPDAVDLGRLSKYDQNIPRAQWVEVPAADPKGYDMRYAFWIEDLGGRIDAKLAGTEAREGGDSAEEIQLFSFFGEAPGSQQATLVAKKTNLTTPGSTRTVLDEQDAARIEPYIYYSFPAPDENIPRTTDIIPHGFGYADAGNLKEDLNKFVLDQDVVGISDHISENLPSFENRKGGFYAPHSYLNTIAANIIDYADVDTNPTTGSDFRGMDSYPMVNQMYDRYERIGEPAVPKNRVRIKVDSYVEFWNPTNQSISGLLRFKNVNRVIISMPFVGEVQFGDITYTIPNFSMEPNEYKVILAGSRTYNYGPFPGEDLDVSFPSDTDDNNFEVYWRDSSGTGGLNLVDTARGIVNRQRSGMPQNDVRWKGNASVVLDTAQGQFGDPRLTFYNTAKNFSNTYATNSAWGSRTNKGSSVRSTARQVLPSEWPDGGSDVAPGVTPRSDNVSPGTTALSNGTAYPQRQGTMNPAVISNSGRYNSIFELGNIFDPVQWNKINEPSMGDVPSADSGAGGGTSLAIGRPEYRAMDMNGLRAAQLLDIFRVDPVPGPGTLVGTHQININTASREVLRSLVAGVTLTADPFNGGILPPSDSEIGDIFADMVISQRNLRPLRSVSDLCNIRRRPSTTRDYSDPTDGPFFGNRDLYPGTQPPPSWNDLGREELFRKIAKLVQFQSKTFKIVVAGEARVPGTQDIIGRSAREYHYRVEPARDPATGLADPGQPVRIFKIYEKSIL